MKAYSKLAVFPENTFKEILKLSSEAKAPKTQMQKVKVELPKKDKVLPNKKQKEKAKMSFLKLSDKEIKEIGFENMVRDFYKIVYDAQLSYSEIGEQLDILRHDPAYMRRQDPQNKYARAKVAALTRLQDLHEQGRIEAAQKQIVNEIESMREDLGELSPYKRRELVRLYGPGKWKQRYSKAWLQDLQSKNAAIAKVVQEELGEPPEEPEGIDERGNNV